MRISDPRGLAALDGPRNEHRSTDGLRRDPIVRLIAGVPIIGRKVLLRAFRLTAPPKS